MHLQIYFQNKFAQFVERMRRIFHIWEAFGNNCGAEKGAGDGKQII